MKIFSSKEEGEDGEKTQSKGDQANELLAEHGGAYLATSVTLSLIFFSLGYALLNADIDVQTLLQDVGVSIDATGEKVGTFALVQILGSDSVCSLMSVLRVATSEITRVPCVINSTTEQ
ncbi:hypothetical protein SADUNF_Sadunf04G0143900 [Salix dunnii]|uniref:DUF1279 domain-containing protein n=1 Tax=Salix dunnii TaxID=1413687 RepID=A0A835N306_9ROSI|nr:hypothetical protein SADUNF_Sadunf04G0143900 [Salix dunnii]